MGVLSKNGGKTSRGHSLHWGSGWVGVARGGVPGVRRLYLKGQLTDPKPQTQPGKVTVTGPFSLNIYRHEGL